MSDERILPTKDQIDAMSDVPALEALRDEVIKATKIIEADLEYRSDADAEWERRAINALAYHRICAGNLARRIARLTGKTQANVAEQAALKAAKAQKHANTLEAAAQALERKRLAVEEQRARTEAQRVAALEKRRAQAIESIRDLNWSRAFVRAARNAIDAETFSAICEEASRVHSERVEQQLLQAVGPADKERLPVATNCAKVAT